MQTADFVHTLREALADLHNRQAEIVVQGNCKDWPDYQKSVGYFACLNDVRDTITKLVRRSNNLEGML